MLDAVRNQEIPTSKGWQDGGDVSLGRLRVQPVGKAE